MTDPDERSINRAIAMLGDCYKPSLGGEQVQDVAEEARAALHRLFRDRRRLEDQVELWETRARFAQAALADHGCGSGCTFPDHPHRSKHAEG